MAIACGSALPRATDPRSVVEATRDAAPGVGVATAGEAVVTATATTAVPRRKTRAPGYVWAIVRGSMCFASRA